MITTRLALLRHLIAAIACASGARRQLARDTDLIADFTAGLRLDLAMVNLALKDPEANDDAAVAEREQANAAVREIATAKAARPGPSELDLPTPTVTAPEAMTRLRTEEHAQHGTP